MGHGLQLGLILSLNISLCCFLKMSIKEILRWFKDWFYAHEYIEVQKDAELYTVKRKTNEHLQLDS